MSHRKLKIAVSYFMLMGLQSFYYTGCEKKFKPNRCFNIYELFKIISVITIISLKLYTNNMSWKIVYENATTVHTFMLCIFCIISYVWRLFKINDRAALYSEMHIVDILLCYKIPNKTFICTFLITLFKLYVLPIFAMINIVLYQCQVESQVSIINMLGNIILVNLTRVLCCESFACLMLTKDIAVALNKRLKDLAKMVHNGKLRSQELAEEINTLAIHYRNITQDTRRYLQLYNVPSLCSMVCTFIGIVVYCFQVYKRVADTAISGKAYDAFNALTAFNYVFALSCDLVLCALITQNNLDEIRKTGRILANICLDDVEDCFKHSVEQFAMYIFINKYKLTLKLYEINAGFIFDKFSTMASFLLIFILSDLNTRFINNK